MGISCGASLIIGKTIVGIIEKKNTQGTSPASQIFLLFSDNTNYEFYSSDRIRGTSDIGVGGNNEVRRYGEGTMEIVFESFVPE
jgi:hypothetical protein